MSNTRRAIFLMTALAVLLGVAAAQDAGQYVILSAQYGNERNHVDVTNRLQELARGDRSFRINHDSMNADPDEGHAKMLRVFARGPNGQERTFDFPDGSAFDGSQFRSWTRGEWGDTSWNGGWNGKTDNVGGQYVILSALYGNEGRHADVTNQLKQMLQRDRFFRLNYQTFGIDPAEGQGKILRVFAQTPNGREQMFEYRDNSLVDGAVFQGWNNGQWGNSRWSGGWNGGSYGGNAGGDAGQYLILSAQYGNERHHVDVTNRLKEMARADQQFRLDYRTFGVDPDEGHAKSLRIFAQGPNGREQMFEYRDGTVIDGAQFRGWGTGQWGTGNWSGNWNGGDSGQYLILSAQYGSDRHHVDVTNRLKEMARADQQFRLDYRTFGVDPDEGHTKSLRIFAQGPSGQEQMFEYRDGTVIDGAQFRGWGTGQWGTGNWSGNWNGGHNAGGDAGQYLILSAQYGNEMHHVDVTNRLKEMARADQQFRLDYRTFGVDPAEGQAKVLRIFAENPTGQEQMFEYRDGSVIDGAQFRGWNNGQWSTRRWSGIWNPGGNRDAGQFVIISAQYGSQRHHVDVTNRLKQMARADQQFRLDYRTFGVDPDKGHAKVLRIYARGPNGRERMFEYRDGTVIDGAQFRGWGRGEWGGANDRWSGRWEGEEREERERR